MQIKRFSNKFYIKVFILSLMKPIKHLPQIFIVLMAVSMVLTKDQNSIYESGFGKSIDAHSQDENRGSSFDQRLLVDNLKEMNFDFINNDINKISFGTISNQVEIKKIEETPPTSNQNVQKNINKDSSSAQIKNQVKMEATQVNKVVIGKGFQVDNGMSYQRIHIGELQKKYLFLDLTPSQKDKEQQVNISVSLQGKSQIIATCTFDDSGSCYISKDRLLKDSTLFISVKCETDCTYSLKSRWSDLEHLRPGQDQVFMFDAEKNQLFLVELADEEFEQVRIHLFPRTTRRPFDNVKIYGTYGQRDPTETNYDFKSVNLWQDGEGIFLLKKNMKSQQFRIFIVGKAQTTYHLVCETIKESVRQIVNNDHIYEYLEPGSTKKYSVKNFDTKIFEEFSFKFSVLSGQANIQYFSDEAMTKKLPISPMQYMKDSQYFITNKQVSELSGNGIYISVSTLKRDAMYTLKFVGITASSPISIHEHVYSFIPVYGKPRMAYFNFKNWITETEQDKSIKFTVSLITINGNLSPNFLLCKTTLQQCTNTKFFQNFTVELVIANTQKISEKSMYQFSIPNSMLTKINNVQQQANILVVLNPEDKDNNSSSIKIAALQFVNNNKVLYLREGRPIQQKFQASQVKFYKYVNSDPDVGQIRIHINELSGNVIVSQIVSENDNKKLANVNRQANTLRFTQKLTQPLVIAISAETKSLIGINMQISHKSDSNNKANLITIGEDLTYTVKIKPFSNTIFQIVPIFYDFRFYYSASSSVLACVMDATLSKCINQNGSQFQPKPSFKQQIKDVDISKSGRKAYIQIMNPTSDRIIQVTAIFHSRDIDRCQKRIIGKLYNEIAKDKSCFDIDLDENNKNGLEIYVSKRQFAKVSYTIFICGNSIQSPYNDKNVKISWKILSQTCSRFVQKWKVTLYWNIHSAQSDISTVKVDYLLQYENAVTLLPEGVGYKVRTLSKSGALRIFGFKVINKIETKIIIESIQGTFMGYAKIVKEAYKDKQQISNINYHFEATYLADYRQQPIITIPEKDLKEADCTDCYISIAIYSMGSDGISVQFQIEVVQKVQSLNDNTAVFGYLQANSFAYYTYQINRKSKTGIMFILSDHNQHCANLYLGELEYPGPTQNLKYTQNSSLLAYQHPGGQKKYFLTVQSTKICEYSISALIMETSLQHLRKGRQMLVQLHAGSRQYFFFENYNQPFKLFAISKFGQLKFYLNRSNTEITKKDFTEKELNVKDFQYLSEQSNVLTVNENNRVFCTNCNYFVVVEALKSTLSTLFLASPLSVIPLMENKYFSDYLEKKGNFTFLRYKKKEKLQLQVTVHTGQIQISVAYKSSQLQQTFSAKSDHQIMTIDLTQKSSNSQNIPEADPNLGNRNSTVRFTQRIPINFMILSMTDGSKYTILATSLQKQKLKNVASYQNILAGQPNHATISSQNVNCLQGYFREDKQDIVITANSDSQKMLNNLIIQAKVNKMEAKITQKIIKNILTLQLTTNQSKYDGADYEICLKYNKYLDETAQNKDNLVQQKVEEVKDDNSEEIILKVVVSQVNTINLLSSDTETIVKNQSIFTIHNEGQILLDVFQCEAEGHSIINYGKTLKQMNKSVGKTIQSIGMTDQKHAITLKSQDLTTYVKVNSKLSVVRWLPIDQQNDQGTGYMKFAIGDLKYASMYKHITVEYQSLQSVKNSKSFIKQIEYILLISNSSSINNKASQCDSNNQSGLIVIRLSTLNRPLKTLQKIYNIYEIQKDFLENNFQSSENVYLTIVAKLTLQLTDEAKKGQKHRNPSSDQHEHYRFIYNRQQIPLESYKQSNLESIPYHFLILLIVSIAGLFLLCTYVFSRKIVPLLARLKNSNWVQQKQGQPPVELVQVPPSSDRNQRAPNIAVETEEGLKK